MGPVGIAPISSLIFYIVVPVSFIPVSPLHMPQIAYVLNNCYWISVAGFPTILLTFACDTIGSTVQNVSKSTSALC